MFTSNHTRLECLRPLHAIFFALCLCGIASSAEAFELSGTKVSLIAGSLNGGGTASTPVGASGATLGATIGQVQPTGEATGASGLRMQAGVWHALPEPGTALGLGVSTLVIAGLGSKRQRARRHTAFPACDGQ